MSGSDQEHPHEHIRTLPSSVPESEDVFPPPARLRGEDGRPKPHIGPDYKAYLNEYAKTVGPDSDKWWKEQAEKELDWYTPFKTVRAGGFEFGDVQWL
jgi:acetyl-CoA synthetase